MVETLHCNVSTCFNQFETATFMQYLIKTIELTEQKIIFLAKLLIH